MFTYMLCYIYVVFTVKVHVLTFFLNHQVTPQLRIPPDVRRPNTLPKRTGLGTRIQGSSTGCLIQVTPQRLSDAGFFTPLGTATENIRSTEQQRRFHRLAQYADPPPLPTLRSPLPISGCPRTPAPRAGLSKRTKINSKNFSTLQENVLVKDKNVKKKENVENNEHFFKEHNSKSKQNDLGMCEIENCAQEDCKKNLKTFLEVESPMSAANSRHDLSLTQPKDQLGQRSDRHLAGIPAEVALKITPQKHSSRISSFKLCRRRKQKIRSLHIPAKRRKTSKEAVPAYVAKEENVLQSSSVSDKEDSEQMEDTSSSNSQVVIHSQETQTSISQTESLLLTGETESLSLTETDQSNVTSVDSFDRKRKSKKSGIKNRQLSLRRSERLKQNSV